MKPFFTVYFRNMFKISECISIFLPKKLQQKMYLNIVRLGSFDEGYVLMGVSITVYVVLLHCETGKV